MRIVYISGRYRHFMPGSANWENWDKEAMQHEIENEAQWATLIANQGGMWIAPLANSVMIEDTSRLLPHDYITRDCVLIRQLRPAYDILLMRPGWGALAEGVTRPPWYPPGPLPVSAGVQLELHAAQEHGLLIFAPPLTSTGEISLQHLQEFLAILQPEPLYARFPMKEHDIAQVQEYENETDRLRAEINPLNH